jgi:hypothetical protein
VSEQRQQQQHNTRMAWRVVMNELGLGMKIPNRRRPGNEGVCLLNFRLARKSIFKFQCQEHPSISTNPSSQPRRLQPYQFPHTLSRPFARWHFNSMPPSVNCFVHKV